MRACDASSADSLRAALRAAGPIDLFCANAGVATVGGCGADDEAWKHTWNLNVMQIAATVLECLKIETNWQAGSAEI